MFGRVPPIDPGLPVHELPEVGIEAAEFFLHSQYCPGVANGRLDLEPIADNAWVGQQPSYLALSKGCDKERVEVLEGQPVAVPLLKDDLPAKPRLRAGQNQELKQLPVIMHRHTPFLIMVDAEQVRARPGATLDCGRRRSSQGFSRFKISSTWPLPGLVTNSVGRAFPVMPRHTL